jgi:hypothetical protein
MMDWSVHVATAGPASSPPLTEAELDVFVECLDTYSPSVTGSTGPEQAPSWSVQLAVTDVPTWEEAVQRVLSAAFQAAQKAGLPAWPVVKVEATRWDIFESEVDRPNYPELVGVTELAALCHVSRQRASSLARRSGFPDPLAELASGPVWDLRQVEQFLDGWTRQPGRPAKVQLIGMPGAAKSWTPSARRLAAKADRERTVSAKQPSRRAVSRSARNRSQERNKARP